MSCGIRTACQPVISVRNYWAFEADFELVRTTSRMGPFRLSRSGIMKLFGLFPRVGFNARMCAFWFGILAKAQYFFISLSSAQREMPL
jgi:hypothetical protein